mgnify:CR=1 FL=1
MGSKRYDGAHKSIENVEAKTKSADGKDAEFKSKDLMKELKDSGEKYTEEDVIFVVKQKNGKLAWLEEGTEGAGLKHIKKHAKEFQKIGVDEDSIAELIREAILHGKMIGYQKTKHKSPREVYEVEFNGKKIKIAITISDNGFIVGANPA